jgi:hypothetical protein
MSLRLGFLHLFGVCRHPQTYRERRELHGVPVLHFVCEDCGHAVPAMQRTPEEHQRAVEAGAIRPAEVRHLPAGVVSLGRRRRQGRTAAATRDTRAVRLATSDGEHDDQGPYSRKVM